VRQDTIIDTMRKTATEHTLMVPDKGAANDKKGPSKVYREVVLKPYKMGPIKC